MVRGGNCEDCKVKAGAGGAKYSPIYQFRTGPGWMEYRKSYLFRARDRRPLYLSRNVRLGVIEDRFSIHFQNKPELENF